MTVRSSQAAEKGTPRAERTGANDTATTPTSSPVEALTRRQSRSEDGGADSTAAGAPERLAETAALAQRIVDTLEKDLGYEHGAVLIRDASAGRLLPIALSDQGKGEAFLREDMAYVASREPRIGVGITGWAARHGMSVVAGDVTRDSRYLGIRDAIRSEVTVPLRSTRGVLGVLNAETTRPEAYTERDARVLALFASHITLAIEHSRLEQQLAGLRRLEQLGLRAGGAAHDINNLLTVVTGKCDVLLRRHDEDRLRQGLSDIKETAFRAARLTQDLMAFRRKDDPRPRRTSLNRLVEGLLGTIRTLAGPRVEVVASLAPDLGDVFVEPAQFERVVLNLALNAAQAMPEGGSLILGTANVDAEPDSHVDRVHGDRSPVAHVELSLRDTGVGMDDETRARLFEPFYSTRSSGTGLGLPTVRRVVEQHGGWISFESSPGRGTTFRIRLPRS